MVDSPEFVRVENGGVDGEGLVTFAHISRTRALWVCARDRSFDGCAAIQIVRVIGSVGVAEFVLLLFASIARAQQLAIDVDRVLSATSATGENVMSVI